MSWSSPSQRSRPDACPGALRVHAAADGGLARVRVPGGRMTTAQLTALGAVAGELGNGVLELTSRANVQVRGLPRSDRDDVAQHDTAEDGAGRDEAGTAAERLAAVGLLPSATHERVRNIIASPRSGCDERGYLDVQPLAAEVDRALCATPELAHLPGRFLIALDDGRRDVTGPNGPDADIALVGLDSTTLGVLLAGQDSGVRVPPRAAASLMVTACRAFLAERGRAAGEHQPAWRLAELALGVHAVAAWLRSVPEVWSDSAPFANGAFAGRGALVGDLGLDPGSGGVTLGVGATLGRVDPVAVEALCVAADAARGEIRVTPWRTVVIPGVPGDAVAGTLSDLATAGLITDPDSPWSGASACAGHPGCAKSLTDVRADAARAITAEDGLQHVPEEFDPHGEETGPRVRDPVHWVGCARRCGLPRGRVVEVVATENGYDVRVDGTTHATAAGPQEAAAVAARARTNPGWRG